MVNFVASEIRMHRDRSGRVRAKHPAAAYAVWKPFTDAFGAIEILARVDDHTADESGVLVEGEGVTVRALPYYAGARSTPRGLLRVRRALREIGSPADVFVGRLPELVTFATLARAHALGAKNIVLFASDPRTLRSLAPGVLGAILAGVLTRLTRRAIVRADAVSYVSERYFQALFPARPGVPTIGRSNVVLPDGWIRDAPRVAPGASTLRIVSVGTLEHNAKGMDFLLNVIAELARRDVNAHLTVVGEGRLRPDLQRMAQERSLDVVFTGQVESREQLRDLLDGADVYASGSRSEGLPRATVEAMARGLPVVSTDVGAAGELVTRPYLTPIDGLQEFCAALELLGADADAYQAQSSQSIAAAIRVSEAARPERLTAFLKEFVADDGRA